MSWAKDIKRLCDKGGHDLGELAKAIKIELFSGIVQDTRVDTGRLRGNWQIQENTPATGSIEVADGTPQGQIPSYQQTEIINESTEVGLTYFVNNLVYAEVWEAKDAMVARNISRVKANVKKMADAL